MFSNKYALYILPGSSCLKDLYLAKQLCLSIAQKAQAKDSKHYDQQNMIEMFVTIEISPSSVALHSLKCTRCWIAESREV